MYFPSFGVLISPFNTPL